MISKSKMQQAQFYVTNQSGIQLAGNQFIPLVEQANNDIANLNVSHSDISNSNSNSNANSNSSPFLGYPAVICVHGFGLKRGGFGLFDTIVQDLQQIGFATFQFDIAGCGESQGNYIHTSLSSQINDLKSIYQYVLTVPQIDSKKIYFVGHSFAATVIIASQLCAKKAAFMGAIFDAQTVFAQIFGEGYNPDTISVKKWSEKWSTSVGSQFWNDVKQYDLKKISRQVEYPCLFLHGDADDKVSVSESRSYVDLINLSDLAIIAGANHMMRPSVSVVSDKIRHFFQTE